MRTRDVLRLHFVALVGLCGCKGLSSAVGPAPTIIRGNAILGPVQEANITIYAILSSGRLDTSNPLGSATTGPQGEYQVTLDTLPTGAVAVQMSGGTYVDEATDSAVTMLADTTYTTLLPTVTDGISTSAAVGPLPEIAYQIFVSQLGPSGPSNTTVAQLATNSNHQVSQAFGIADVVGTLPADPYGSIPSNDSGQYALLMAALSSAANSVGTDVTALTSAYAKNLITNGNLTAVSAQPATTGTGTTASITPPSLATLATTTQDLADGTKTLANVAIPATLTAPVFNPTPTGVP